MSDPMSGPIRPPYPDGLEELLTQALAARTDTVGAGDLRPALPPWQRDAPRWRGLRRAVPTALGLAAAVAAVVILVHGVNGGPPDPSVGPAGPSVSPTGSPSPLPSPRTSGPPPVPPSSSPVERSGAELPGPSAR